MLTVSGFKLGCSLLAMALTVAGFYPYIRGMVRGSFKPHLYSWLIWALTTTVVFLAQLQAGGGPGAWATGVSGLLTLLVAGLAWRCGADGSVTRSDRWFLGLAVASLLPWYLLHDPWWTVVCLTVADLLGFGPTFRRAYAAPHLESAGFYALFLVRNLLLVLALERYVPTTWLFPAAMALACFLLVVLILARRRMVAVP